MIVVFATVPFSSLHIGEKVAGLFYILWTLIEFPILAVSRGAVRGRLVWAIWYAVSRKRSTGGLRKLEVAFLAMACAEVGIRAFFLPLMHLLFKPRNYKAWLKSFDEEE